jgi:hypothetical protein
VSPAPAKSTSTGPSEVARTSTDVYANDEVAPSVYEISPAQRFGAVTFRRASQWAVSSIVPLTASCG